MGRKQLCPNGSKKGSKKKTPKRPPKKSSNTPPSGGSSHKGTVGQIGKFTAEQMQACIDEIRHYQDRMKWLGLPKMEKSMNQISRERGLSPATVNKRMTGKVTGMGSQLGGARRGKVMSAGEFQAIWLLRCNFYPVCMHACLFNIFFQLMSIYWQLPSGNFSSVGSPSQ